MPFLIPGTLLAITLASITLKAQGVKPRRHVRNGTGCFPGVFRQPMTHSGFDSQFHPPNENWLLIIEIKRSDAQLARSRTGCR